MPDNEYKKSPTESRAREGGQPQQGRPKAQEGSVRNASGHMITKKRERTRNEMCALSSVRDDSITCSTK